MIDLEEDYRRATRGRRTNFDLGWCGGARITTSRMLWDFADVDGIDVVIQPVIAELSILDLIAWHPDRPNRWWWRIGVPGLVLGAEIADEAECYREAVRVYRTPFAWLQAPHGTGICPLDSRSRHLLISAAGIVADDYQHAREIDRLFRSGDPIWPKIEIPKVAA